MVVPRACRSALLVCGAALVLAAAACGGGGGGADVTISATGSAPLATKPPATTPVVTATIGPVVTPGPAATLQLSADPQELKCDGEQSSAVTARVLDSAGQPVNDGTSVTFSVQALATADPIDTETFAGEATTSVTALGARVGVVVNVTSGKAAAAIRIDCL